MQLRIGPALQTREQLCHAYPPPGSGHVQASKIETHTSYRDRVCNYCGLWFVRKLAHDHTDTSNSATTATIATTANAATTTATTTAAASEP
jgi:hypothetical protein